ncbi:phBC6A51 family helix-turn-helix protein [Acetonema longum]|nr:phBC6A51 family helix-turn-helix protein [Acetonema longum]
MMTQEKQTKKSQERKRPKTVSVWTPRPELVRVTEMLLNPDDRRSKAEKIKAAGLTEQVFYRWMKDERFVNYLNKQIDKYTNSEINEVWKALVRKCKIGDTSAIKLFFELKGLYKDQKQIEHTGKDGKPIETETRIIIDYGDGADG